MGVTGAAIKPEKGGFINLYCKSIMIIIQPGAAEAHAPLTSKYITNQRKRKFYFSAAKPKIPG
jgi:hypothetical protein